MKPDCLFCELSHDPDKIIWENADFAAFKDIHPKAKLHLLVVPKEHIASFDDLSAQMSPGLVAAIQEVARSQGVTGAYRLNIYVGQAGGQEIDHLHAHLMAD
jgi:histidine triad (HIT) family protein